MLANKISRNWARPCWRLVRNAASDSSAILLPGIGGGFFILSFNWKRGRRRGGGKRAKWRERKKEKEKEKEEEGRKKTGT